jgi:hypothetical protein
MYVAPSKNLPGLKARTNALKAQHAAKAAAAQAQANAEALAKVAQAVKA